MMAALRSSFAVVGALAAPMAVADTIICPSAQTLTDVAALERALETHSLAFVANVELIGTYNAGQASWSWSYRLLPPALKGEPPQEGTVSLSTSCEMPQLALRATVLFFLNDLSESAGSENSVSIVYGEGAIVEEWILNWIAGKVGREPVSP